MGTTAAIIDRIAADPVPPPLRPLVFFSFGAYSKAVAAHLRASGIAVAPGLCDSEFSAIESTYGFEFPPDIRSILREGLPFGPGFPNWRFASPQQLRLLLHLPAAGLLQEISTGFWPPLWGTRPRDPIVAAATARASLSRAPPLVPVYRYFYIPVTPVLAGNPVFYVRGANVRLAGIDLADFFRRERPGGWASGVPAPAWAATSARRVDVWTELADGCASTYRESSGSPWEERVERQLEEAGRRLKEAGWSKEEVGEMVAAGSSSFDGHKIWTSATENPSVVLRHRDDVLRQLRLLSLALLRGGWCSDDVWESMGWGDAATTRGAL